MSLYQSLKRYKSVGHQFFKPYYKWLPLWIFFCATLSVMVALQSYFLGLIIDGITNIATNFSPEVIKETQLIFIIALSVFLATEIFAGIHSLVGWRVGNHVSTMMTYKAMQDLLEKDTDLFEKQKLGSLQKKVDQYYDASFHIVHSFSTRFTQIFLDIVFILAFGFYLNWRLTLVVLTFVPLVIALGMFTTRLASTQQKKLSGLYSKQSGIISDALQNIKTVKAFTMETRLLRRLWKSLDTVRVKQDRLNRLWALSDTLSGSIFALSRLVIVGIGIWFIAKGWATVGSLITFAGFAGQFLGSIRASFREMPNLVKNIKEFEETQDTLDKPVFIKNTTNPERPRQLNGNIIFKNISFAYGKKKVIRNVNLEIPENKTTAIVGFSGAGKSTLIKLLMRYIDADQGQIMIGDNEIRDIDIKTLRQKTGLVLQENVLFNESVLENIRIGRVSATKEEVIEAAKKAQAHNFIEKLPKGYGTRVGDRGVKLSGGERQRIAIARIFLENPDILILDEATSALDSKTEHDLQIALEKVTDNRTSVIIAHRLSTIMKADQIVVMDQGKIVDIGTHFELIKRDGQYKDFWNIQAGGYS